jgi:hypothetical protein
MGEVQQTTVVKPRLKPGTRDIIVGLPTDPPPPFTTWCEWATWVLQQALDGLTSSTGNVRGYTVGSRSVQFKDLADQQKAIDLANQLVLYFCGVEVLPQSVTGRDTAVRIIPRDL